ncbi:MAG: hypothetical protein WB699_05190 [Bacteroidota bacterium]
MLFVSVGGGVLTLLLSSCSANLPVQRDLQRVAEDTSSTLYSVVFVIHGDGDYLYHDTSGREYKADEQAVAGAKRVAEQNPNAEVFIFHQKPRGHFLFFFPLHDGEFSYYRNGRLIAEESYWRDQGQSPMSPEVDLYRRFRAERRDGMVSLFVYCGHEIPELGGAGYDASYPDRPFTVHDLAVGLKGFTPRSGRFDLLLLSTCFGGTPYTIGALGSFARYIIASPDYLHLSYFDLRPLERLDLGLQDGDVHAFAERFAQRAFDRLTGEVQTVVSVAVYDVDSVQEYLHSVQGVYDQTLTRMGRKTPASRALMEHCDCADIAPYALATMNEGVDVLYRPPRFGRSKNKQNHSGWECWRENGLQGAASRTTKPLQK